MNLTDTRGFVHLKEKGPEAADLYTMFYSEKDKG